MPRERHIGIAAWGDHQGPFFLSSSMSPLTKPTSIVELRKILMALGLPDINYAGHSFRIGAATSAALAGVEESTIHCWDAGRARPSYTTSGPPVRD